MSLKVPYLNLPAQFDCETLWEKLKAQFKSCMFIMGPEVEQFEKAFAELCGVKYALGLNSGTDALFLSMKALGIGPGDEVITAPNSFIASAGSIVAVGARPVFCDVGPDYNMDPASLAKAITPLTKAVMPVHLTGNLADMPAILEITEPRGIWVLEDAAQAVMAALNGQKAGSFGLAGCFSLHPLKNLNCAGDAGMLTTNNPDLYEKVRQLKNHGLKNRDEIDFFGYSSRLDTIQAVIGLHGLSRLEETTRKRRQNAAVYDRELAGLGDDLVIPPRDPARFHVFHTYVVQVNHREELVRFLATRGVETKIHYPIPLHLQAPARAMGYGPGDFPVCEAQAGRILTLPIHQHLSGEQLLYACGCIKEFFGAL